MDVICQAKSGMGKTAVFVLAVLQQLEPVPGEVGALILCHTRELAYQICHEFERFSAYLPNVNVSVVFGGVNIKTQKEQLKEKPPSVIVATPGRLKALAKDGDVSLKQCGHFILDECDKMLEQLGTCLTPNPSPCGVGLPSEKKDTFVHHLDELDLSVLLEGGKKSQCPQRDPRLVNPLVPKNNQKKKKKKTLASLNRLTHRCRIFFLLSIFIFTDMRADVQEIFKMTPHDKQVMMFSATLSKEIRPVCKKFMNDVSCTTTFARCCQPRHPLRQRASTSSTATTRRIHPARLFIRNHDESTDSKTATPARAPGRSPSWRSMSWRSGERKGGEGRCLPLRHSSSTARRRHRRIIATSEPSLNGDDDAGYLPP